MPYPPGTSALAHSTNLAQTQATVYKSTGAYVIKGGGLDHFSLVKMYLGAGVLVHAWIIVFISDERGVICPTFDCGCSQVIVGRWRCGSRRVGCKAPESALKMALKTWYN